MNTLFLKISSFFSIILPYSIYLILGVNKSDYIYRTYIYTLGACSLISILYLIYFFKIRINKTINNFEKYSLTYVDVKKENSNFQTFIILNTMLLLLSNKLKPNKQSLIAISSLILLVGLIYIKNSLYTNNPFLELLGLSTYEGTAIFDDNIKRNLTLIHNKTIYKNEDFIYYVSNLEYDIYFVNSSK